MLAASLSAQAADMPLYKAPPPAPVPFSWTGFYIGAHVGGGWGSREFDFDDLTPAAPFWDSSARSMVRSPAVRSAPIGKPARRCSASKPSAAGQYARQGHLQHHHLFLVRGADDRSRHRHGRLGVDIDRTLVYVEGGVASMHEDSTISNVALPPLPIGFSSTLGDDRTGWTLASASIHLRHALVGKLGTLHDFGPQRYNFRSPTRCSLQ